MISFRFVRWKNFLSTGNALTEIKLDQHATTLISGTNGAGKSTLLDVLSFALFKKAFRNINLPTLINTVNQRDCLVEVEFDVGSRSYLVRRGMKPHVFEVFSNGELIPQSANVYDYQDNLEKNILRMTHKTFCQIVVLGSAGYTPFMLLPAQARREIIENLLDIDVFSRMNTLLKNQQRDIESKMTEIEQKERLVSSRISLIEKHLRDKATDNQELIDTLEKDIDGTGRSIDDLQTQIAAANGELSALTKPANITALQSKIAKHQEAKRQLEKRRSTLLDSLSKFEKIEECPTCSQSISDAVRTRISSQKYGVIDKIEQSTEELSRKLQAFQSELDTASDHQRAVDELNAKIRNLENERYIAERHVHALQNQLGSLQKAKDEIDTSELERHQTALQRVLRARDIAVEKADLLKTAATLLKDGGIKTMIIRQYIPVMNRLINKFLEQMDFFCIFEIDETFEEKMKAVYKDELEYTSLSQGERMRVDIALLFTWREIARMRNASLTNILILDEIMDSSLDSAGTEEFLRIVKDISQSSNIFIISHKADQIVEKFDNHVRFVKRNNFSQIEAEE